MIVMGAPRSGEKSPLSLFWKFSNYLQTAIQICVQKIVVFSMVAHRYILTGLRKMKRYSMLSLDIIPIVEYNIL